MANGLCVTCSIHDCMDTGDRATQEAKAEIQVSVRR
jgi:hypothetical protein